MGMPLSDAREPGANALVPRVAGGRRASETTQCARQHSAASLHTHVFAMKVAGMRVAISSYVTRIGCSLRKTRRTEGRSLVPTAGPFANARSRPHRSDYLGLARRQHADAPAIKPTFFRTMGGFRYSADLFIVFRPAPARNGVSAFRLLSMLDSGPFANTLCV